MTAHSQVRNRTKTRKLKSEYTVPKLSCQPQNAVRPKSHLLYGEDTAAVHPLNLQKRAAAAVFQTWPRGGPMSYGYILQAVGAPWNYSAEL